MKIPLPYRRKWSKIPSGSWVRIAGGSRYMVILYGPFGVRWRQLQNDKAKGTLEIDCVRIKQWARNLWRAAKGCE